MERFKQLIADPYSPDMDAIDWFLFIGLILVILTLWRLTFDMISGVVRT